MSIKVIKVIHVSKKFGEKEIIRDLSFNVNKGEVLGVIGPNGAGKTTLLRIIATLLIPTSGQVILMEKNTQKEGSGLRDNIGYMPEDAGHYLRLSALENLRFYASFYNSSAKEKAIDDYLKRFGLWNHKDVPVGKFSQGMKRRLHFIRAIVHDPLILIFDEPFIFMDPDSRLLCMQFIRESASQKKKCILISSHSLNELEKICNRVLFIEKGKEVFNESVDFLKARYKNPIINNLEDIYLTFTK